MADDTDEVIQSVRETENDLLQGAFEPAPEKEPAKETPQAPEPPAPQTEAAQEQPAGETRVRDPATGRFVRAEGQQPAAPAEQTAQAETDEDRVPSWRVREINEEKRRVQAELEQVRVENARLAAWRAQIEREHQQQQQKATPLPDPVIDPQGFYNRVYEDIYSRFAGQAANDRLNFSLELAASKYGERFEKAFEAVVHVCQSGHPQFARQFVNQANPGKAIMDWYARVERDQAVGPDLNAYNSRYEENLLKNPEFLAKANERYRQQALNGGAPQSSGQPGKPNTVVQLPPSLTRATGTAEMPQTATDGSEEALFDYAINSKRRR